ncbi:hypothetical protein THIX_10696 [Thiomonas sp. X19]|nr:hypothetical protein THIX_10696 [Thiomonas sp. X19]
MGEAGRGSAVPRPIPAAHSGKLHHRLDTARRLAVPSGAQAGMPYARVTAYDWRRMVRRCHAAHMSAPSTSGVGTPSSSA